MALPALAGLISAAGSLGQVGQSGLNLIGGAVSGGLSGTVPLEKALSKINTALGPVTQAFDKTATQASQLYGTFFKLKNGFDTAINIIGTIGGAVAKAVTAVVTTVANTVTAAVTTAINGDLVAKPIKALASAIQLIQTPALNVAGALGEFQKAVTAVGEAVVPFVQKASPGVVLMFRRAADDLTASIGRALVPVLEQATKFTRGFADVVFALSGPVQKLVKAFDPLADLFPKLTDLLSPIVRYINLLVELTAELIKPLSEMAASQLGDAIDLVAISFKGMVAAMEPVLRVTIELARAYGTIMAIVGPNGWGRVLRGAGAFSDRGSITGGSVGAAATGAQVGSVESALNKALTSAFSIGSGASPEEKSASYLQKLYDEFMKFGAKIEPWLQVIPTLPASFAEALLSGSVVGGGLVGGGLAKSGVVGDAVDAADEWARANFGFGFR